MKVLFLMYRFPYPLDRGDKLRAYYQIKHLARKHDVYLYSIVDDEYREEYQKELAPYCKEMFFHRIGKKKFYINLIKNLINGKPLQLAFAADDEIKSELKEIVSKYQIDASTVIMIRAAENLVGVDVRKTLDYQDAISIGFARRSQSLSFPRSLLYSIEAKRLAEYENYLFDQFDEKVIITEEDRKFIQHDKQSEIKIIRNGISLDYFKADKQVAKVYDIAFVGNMTYEPNIVSVKYMVEKIMPIVWQTHPEAKVLVAGADPVEEIRALSSEKVFVSGRLDDIRSAYNSARIFLAPMQLGTGLQNKLLEAMAMHLPVVTSALCNYALNAIEGKEILVCSSPSDYAESVVRLLDNPLYASEISENAYKFLEANFSWDSVNAEYEKIIFGQ